MNFNDPIADFLTRIRNGGKAEHRFVDIPWSKMKQRLAEILQQNGFIESYLVKVEDTRGTIRVFLKYTAGRVPVINQIKRVSKPGLRRYVSKDEIPHFFGGLGVPVLSTSKGILSGAEAHDQNVGGELLCLVC